MFGLILKWRNRLIAFCCDMTMTLVAWFGAFWLFYDLHITPLPIFIQALIWSLPVLLLQATICWLLGLYRGVWRFASIPDLIRITKAVIIGTFGILILFLVFNDVYQLPKAIILLYALLLEIELAGARALFRWLKDYRHLFGDSERVLIVGAGNAGEGIIRDLLRHSHHNYQPIILVDDNPIKLGRDIHGVRVVGNCDKIPALVERYKIDLILIAIPSASSAQMRRVVNLCEQTKLPFRTLPGLNDLASGRVDIKLLRNISLEDLLGRGQVQIDWQSIGRALQHKKIVVTGGGGSIGSELCRQIALMHPKQLVVIDNSEYNLYAIDMELKTKFPYLNLQSVLISVTDAIGIQSLFSQIKPEYVFHAAAYKHVPLLETQERVAIHNNVLGTNILAKVAVDTNVEKFVLISTDKAVNPTNLMGATKRAAEMICQSLYQESRTSFVTVRFGNVLDSAGSVVPLFRKQIQAGGPLTVTHPDITRYFMSIAEASQLIVQAALLGKGGEIFVLDMGEPIKIRYLAEQMIKLSGKEPGHDIEISYIGLRPGEKLYEELFYANEKLQPTPHSKIMLANARKIDKHVLMQYLERIEKNYLQKDAFLSDLLNEIVPEYQNSSAHYYPLKENLHLVASQ